MHCVCTAPLNIYVSCRWYLAFCRSLSLCLHKYKIQSYIHIQDILSSLLPHDTMLRPQYFSRSLIGNLACFSCLASFFKMPKIASLQGVLYCSQSNTTRVRLHAWLNTWSLWTLCGFIMLLQWGGVQLVYVLSGSNTKWSVLCVFIWNVTCFIVNCGLFKILLATTRNFSHVLHEKTCVISLAPFLACYHSLSLLLQV